jgi:hypothetical protein
MIYARRQEPLRQWLPGTALLDARDDGMLDEEYLRVALLDVDVDELVLRLRGSPNSAERA